MSSPFRVLATCATFEPGFRGGGPVRSMARILGTAPAHIDVSLVTSDPRSRVVATIPGPVRPVGRAAQVPRVLPGCQGLPAVASALA